MSFVFEIDQINYRATLSLRAYRRRHAHDSEVKVVSLLKCRSFIQIIIVGYFCIVICFWNRRNYGASLSLTAYRRRAQDSEVMHMVVSLLKCWPFIQITIVGNFWSVIYVWNRPNLFWGYPLPQSLQAARPRFWGDGSLSFEMSVIIQIIIIGLLCTVICFEIGQINYGATLSLRAYRRRAQDSEVMVVSLLKCRSLSKLLL